jgi:hypothetical protein
LARDHGQREKKKIRERGITLTDAQVLVWMAWQGSACAAGQRLPEEDFTEHTPGAPHHGTSTGEYSPITSTRGGTSNIEEKARRGTKSEAIDGSGNRGETTPDLPGEEDPADSNWSKW